jgi:hypothetical protein
MDQYLLQNYWGDKANETALFKWFKSVKIVALLSVEHVLSVNLPVMSWTARHTFQSDAGKSNIAAYYEIISSGKMCSDPGA